MTIPYWVLVFSTWKARQRPQSIQERSSSAPADIEVNCSAIIYIHTSQSSEIAVTTWLDFSSAEGSYQNLNINLLELTHHSVLIAKQHDFSNSPPNVSFSENLNLYTPKIGIQYML